MSDILCMALIIEAENNLQTNVANNSFFFSSSLFQICTSITFDPHVSPKLFCGFILIRSNRDNISNSVNSHMFTRFSFFSERTPLIEATQNMLLFNEERRDTHQCNIVIVWFEVKLLCSLPNRLTEPIPCVFITTSTVSVLIYYLSDYWNSWTTISKEDTLTILNEERMDSVRKEDRTALSFDIFSFCLAVANWVSQSLWLKWWLLWNECEAMKRWTLTTSGERLHLPVIVSPCSFWKQRSTTDHRDSTEDADQRRNEQTATRQPSPTIHFSSLVHPSNRLSRALILFILLEMIKK